MELIFSLILIVILVPSFILFLMAMCYYAYKMIKGLGEPPTYGHYDDIVGDDEYPYHEGP